MVNLNECKFGDKMKMRNGKMAIYVGRDPCCASHFLVIESIELGYGMLYASDNGFMGHHIDSCYDIIGKWKDENETTQ